MLKQRPLAVDETKRTWNSLDLTIISVRFFTSWNVCISFCLAFVCNSEEFRGDRCARIESRSEFAHPTAVMRGEKKMCQGPREHTSLAFPTRPKPLTFSILITKCKSSSTSQAAGRQFSRWKSSTEWALFDLLGLFTLPHIKYLHNYCQHISSFPMILSPLQTELKHFYCKCQSWIYLSCHIVAIWNVCKM